MHRWKDTLIALLISVVALYVSDRIYGDWVTRFMAGTLLQQMLAVLIIVGMYQLIYTGIKLVRIGISMIKEKGESS